MDDKKKSHLVKWLSAWGKTLVSRSLSVLKFKGYGYSCYVEEI